MKKVSLTGLIFLVLLIPAKGYCQNIRRILEQLQTDTVPRSRAGLYFQLAQEYFKANIYTKAAENFSLALETDTSDTEQKIQARYGLINSYAQLGDFSQIKKCGALLLAEFAQNRAKKEELLEELAFYAMELKKYDDAIQYYKSLFTDYVAKNELTKSILAANHIGHCLRETGKIQESLDYFDRALTIAGNEKKYPKPVAYVLINKSASQILLKEYLDSKENLEKAKQIAISLKDTSLIATARNYLAANLYLLNMPGQALNEAEKAMSLSIIAEDNENLISAYKNLIAIYASIDNYQQSLAYEKLLRELLEKTKKQNERTESDALQAKLAAEKKEQEVKEFLAENEKRESRLRESELEKKRQFQEIMIKEQQIELLSQQQQLKDASLKNTELEKIRIQNIYEIGMQKALLQTQRLLTEAKAQEAERAQLLAENERKAKEFAEKQKNYIEEQRKLEEENLKFGRQIIALITIMIVIILVVFIIVVRNLVHTKQLNRKMADKNRQIETQNSILIEQKAAIESINKELKLKNDSITASIVYASRLQNALLPKDRGVGWLDSSVLYLPRDIVSGDFYWYEQNEDKIFLAVADCTGHGVPGAMMSMLGISVLNSIIHDKKIYRANEILKALNEEVVNALDQRNTMSSDGMDILLMVLDKSERTIELAASKQGFIYFKNGKIHEISGDRYPIGYAKRDEERDFKATTLKVSDIDVLYMSSDGFKDQFGGEENTKFGKKKFLELLTQIHPLSTAQQVERLNAVLQEWKGDHRQTDDITVMVVKFK